MRNNRHFDRFAVVLSAAAHGTGQMTSKTTETTSEDRTDLRALEDAELDAVTGGWGLINFGTGTGGKIAHSDLQITKVLNASSA